MTKPELIANTKILLDHHEFLSKFPCRKAEAIANKINVEYFTDILKLLNE